MGSGGAESPQQSRGVAGADQVDAARDWLRSHGIEAPEPEQVSGSRRRTSARTAEPAGVESRVSGPGHAANRREGHHDAHERVEDDLEDDAGVEVEVEGSGSGRPRPRSRRTSARSDGRARRERRGRPGSEPGDPDRPPSGEDDRARLGTGRSRAAVDDGADPDADPEDVARTIVLRKLAAQARTRAELERALKSKAVPEEAASAVLDRMGEVGLVDDAAFARDWVASRQQRRHLSRTALRRELQTKGVDREVIDEALVGVDGADEHRAALDLASRRAATMSGLPRDVAYRRLGGVLARRGFSAGVTTQVLGEVLGGWVEE